LSIALLLFLIFQILTSMIQIISLLYLTLGDYKACRKGDRQLRFIHRMNSSPDRTITDKAVPERQQIVTGYTTMGIDQNKFIRNRFGDITKTFKPSIKTGEILHALIGIFYGLGIYNIFHIRILQFITTRA